MDEWDHVAMIGNNPQCCNRNKAADVLKEASAGHSSSANMDVGARGNHDGRSLCKQECGHQG